MNKDSRAPRSFDLKALLRWTVCILYVFLCGAFQTSFFSASGIFPATPDLLLTSVAAVALMTGEKIGSVCGLVAGTMIISLGGGGTALFPLIYCLEGWIFGIIGKNGIKRNVLSWTMYSLPLAIVRSMISLLYVFSTEVSINLVLLFKNMIVPEFLLTLIFSYIAFPLSYLIHVILGEKDAADAETQEK